MKVLVLNGPNLNLLGHREPGVYGADSLADVQRRLDDVALSLGVELEHAQSNHEGELVDIVQRAAATTAGAVINAGAYTHTSIALRDALLGTGLLFVEIHVSNVYKREPFRHTSLLADIASGVVGGFGVVGYELALRGLVARLQQTQ